MTEPRYRIVHYHPDLESEVVELERRLWQAPRTTSLGHLRWKYGDNPLADRCQRFVALTDGRVVGVRGLMANRWEAAAAGSSAAPVVFDALSASDLFIEEEHRNTGLHRMLVGHALEVAAARGGRLVLNFSASSLNRLNSLVAGWREAGALPIVRRGGVPLASTIARITSLVRDPVRTFERQRAARFEVSATTITLSDTARPLDMATLVRTIPWDGRIRQLRDEQYFSWRFSSPMYCHRYVYCDADTGLAGYAVLQMRRHQPEQGIAIVDFEAATPDIAAALLRGVTRWVPRAVDIRAVVPSTGDGYATAFAGAGFAMQKPVKGTRRFKPALLVRALDRDAVQLLERDMGRRFLDIDDWALRLIYSDAY